MDAIALRQRIVLMPYIVGVGIPALLQCLLIWILIAANTGNGSFIGLAAFLIGLLAVPLTAIINSGYIASRKDKKGLYLYTIPNCYMIALATPVVLSLMLLIG